MPDKRKNQSEMQKSDAEDVPGSAAWEAVKKTIIPLESRVAPPPSAPVPRGVRYRNTELPAEWTQGTNSAGPSPSIDRKLRRKIATGRQEFDRSIDLHGMTQNEAHSVLLRMIEGCIRRGDKTILIVTGKGGRRFRQSGDAVPVAFRTREDFGQHGGVLRRMVPLWLSGPDLKPFIHSFAPAAQEHGGDGALYVVLRSRPSRSSRNKTR